jgi:hypothetical protein
VGLDFRSCQKFPHNSKSARVHGIPSISAPLKNPAIADRLSPCATKASPSIAPREDSRAPIVHRKFQVASIVADARRPQRAACASNLQRNFARSIQIHWIFLITSTGHPATRLHNNEPRSAHSSEGLCTRPNMRKRRGIAFRAASSNERNFDDHEHHQERDPQRH